MIPEMHFAKIAYSETQDEIRNDLFLELELRIVFSIVAVEMERRAATRDWSPR